MFITSPRMPERYYALVIQVYSEAQGDWVDYKVLGVEGPEITQNQALDRLENIHRVYQSSYRFRLVRRLISDEVVSHV